jgi:DNA-binding MarR family transcriptional regulator
MLACAIIIKNHYQNSCLYDLKITSVMELFGVSHKKAHKVLESLRTHELFIYNPEKDCIFAKSFKSNDVKHYGKKQRYAAKADYCRKLQVKDGMILRELVRELRNTLLLCAINASEHDGFNTSRNKKVIATKQNATHLMPQRILAKVIGMSKSSVSRYIDKMEDNNVVSKTQIVAECVIPVLNEKTENEYRKNHSRKFVVWHNASNGGWSGWWILGRGYSILKREVSESFKNVIYNYKRTNKIVAKTSSELDGDGFWSKFC